MNAKVAMKAAIELAGSEAKLGKLAGFSQVAINKAKNCGRVSAEMAVRVDAATSGAVPKSALRPDLWPPHDLPSAKDSAA